MKYSNNSLWKKVIGSPISLLVLLVLTYVLVRAVLNINHKSETSKDRLAQAQMELANLEARQQEVSSKVAQLSTEQGIEAEVRTKFHAVKEGESVAVIIDGSQGANVVRAVSPNDAIETKPSWWRRVLGWVGL